MSRSVTMPVRRPFSVTGITPASSRFMTRAASTMFRRVRSSKDSASSLHGCADPCVLLVLLTAATIPRAVHHETTRTHVDVVTGPHTCTCVAKGRQQLVADDDALRRRMRADVRFDARRTRDVLQTRTFFVSVESARVGDYDSVRCHAHVLRANSQSFAGAEFPAPSSVCLRSSSLTSSSGVRVPLRGR
jgi:hypothetical protein